MLDEIVPLPEDPEELRAFTARLLAEVKAQAILIEKLRHQLAGHRAPSLRRLLGDGRAAAAGAGDERDRRGGDDGAAAPARHRGEGPAEAPADPGPRPADGGGAQPCSRRLRRLRRQAAPDRRGRDRRAGIRPRPLHREPDRPARGWPAPCCERFVQAPLPSRPIERGRPGPGPARPCAGQQVRRPPAALSPEPDLRARRARPRPLHARRLGRQVHRAARAAGRRHRPARARGRGDLRRRHAGPHARARHRQDPDRPALDLCPRRAPLGRRARRRRPGIASRATARGSIRRTISPASAASCMPTAMPASTTSTAPAPSARSPAWPTSGASSSTSIASQASPIAEEAIQRIARLYAVEKEARGSPPERRVDAPPGRGRPGLRRPRSLARPSSCPASPASRPSPPRSATPWRGWSACAPISPTASSSSTTTPPSAACAPSPSAGRTISSSAPRPAERPPPSPTP